MVTGVRCSEDARDQIDQVMIRTKAGEIIKEAKLVVGETSLRGMGCLMRLSKLSICAYSFLVWEADASGPTQAGYRKWLPTAGFCSLPSDLRERYDPHYQIVTGIFTVPDHLKPDVPIPWGFRPGLLHIEPANVVLNEDRGFVGSVINNDQRELWFSGRKSASPFAPS